MGIIVLCCFVVGWWLLWPDKIVTIDPKVTVDKEFYKPGDRITYTLSYCKTRKMPGEVSRALVNSVRITFTDVTSDLPTGCHTVRISDLVIPDYVDSGLYHIEGSGLYQVNPIKKFLNTWKSNEFQIVK